MRWLLPALVACGGSAPCPEHAPLDQPDRTWTLSQPSSGTVASLDWATRGEQSFEGETAWVVFEHRVDGDDLIERSLAARCERDGAYLLGWESIVTPYPESPTRTRVVLDTPPLWIPQGAANADAEVRWSRTVQPEDGDAATDGGSGRWQLAATERDGGLRVEVTLDAPSFEQAVTWTPDGPVDVDGYTR